MAADKEKSVRVNLDTFNEAYLRLANHRREQIGVGDVADAAFQFFLDHFDLYTKKHPAKQSSSDERMHIRT